MCSLRVRSLETATENLPQADAHPDNELSHAMTNRIGARVALLATVTCLLLMGTSFANLRKLDDVSAENLVHESKAVVSALEKGWTTVGRSRAERIAFSMEQPE